MVHVIGNFIHLQCIFKEIIQDALGCILDVGSHEVVQVDDLIDGVCLVFGKEFHPRVELGYFLYCAICAVWDLNR